MLDLQNSSRDWKTQHGKFSSSRTKQAVIILGIYRSHNIDRVAIVVKNSVFLITHKKADDGVLDKKRT
ncbi:unnamed protein product [Sphagnum troendelagicum]|uniref:Uncharacterized protein n=1 Tax=Sphagnum troendelagicum TaxID=128251 RepID=A0ABP0U0Z7_9BRYO